MLSPAAITRRSHAPENRFPFLRRVGECLYRSGSGYYYAVLKVKGKQLRMSLRTDDGSIARRKLVEIRRQSRRLVPAGMMFEKLTEQYLEFIGARAMKPASFRRRVVAVRSLSHYFGGKNVRTINRLNVERRATARTQDCSSRSFNVDLETLKQVFTYAVEHGFVFENPAAAIRQQRQVKAAVVIPTKQQFKLLVDDWRLGQQTQRCGFRRVPRLLRLPTT